MLESVVKEKGQPGGRENKGTQGRRGDSALYAGINDDFDQTVTDTLSGNVEEKCQQA